MAHERSGGIRYKCKENTVKIRAIIEGENVEDEITVRLEGCDDD